MGQSAAKLVMQNNEKVQRLDDNGFSVNHWLKVKSTPTGNSDSE